MGKSLGGVLAPVVTTFDGAMGAVTLDPFTENIEAHLAAGLNGVVVAGSTGEAALLDEEERRTIVERARSRVPADRWLIVGAGAESTSLTLRRCRDAKELGADAVLVVAPHYYGGQMSPAALEAHYRRVADASPLPVLVYNIPKYMHFTIEPELIARLATHDNIIGMKDSAGDLGRLAGYVASQSPTFTVLTGHGGSWYQALELGVRGGILAVALFAVELTLEVWQRFVDGSTAEGKAAQDVLTPLAIEIVGKMGVPGVKAAMERVGLRGGPVRSPLLPVEASELARIETLVRGARTPATA
jgi:dihydrodipicolinate synthase/N-acetylneuraminate lyase